MAAVATTMSVNANANTNATTATVKSASKNKPIDPAEFDVNNITFGNGQVSKNGFTKYQIHYNRPGNKDTKCILKFSNVVVNTVIDPSKVKKDGVVAPANAKPNYSISVKITNPEHLKCLEALETFIKSYVYENKMSLIPQKPEKQTEEDIDSYFKNVLYLTDNRDYPLFSVNFPFGDEREPVEVKYLDKSVPKSVVESLDPTQKMGRESVVDMFVYLKNLKIDSGNTISIQRSTFSIVKVHKYVAPSSGGVNSGKPMNGTLLEDIDTSQIDIGGIVTNNNGGKSIKPKIKYIAGDGSEKLKNISIHLPNVQVRFRKLVNKDDGSVSFSAIYEPSREHLDKFNELDDYFKKTIFEKISKKELPASAFGVKTMTANNWDTKFRGAVSASNPNYPPSLWFTIYATTDPTNPDKFGFAGNFYNTDGEKYPDEEIESKIIGESFNCDLNIYLKHVWIGKVYSLKYNISNVSIDLVANEYDLGDETYYEGEEGEEIESEADTSQVSSPVENSVVKAETNSTAASSSSEEESEEESETEEESD